MRPAYRVFIKIAQECLRWALSPPSRTALIWGGSKLQAPAKPRAAQKPAQGKSGSDRRSGPDSPDKSRYSGTPTVSGPRDTPQIMARLHHNTLLGEQFARQFLTLEGHFGTGQDAPFSR